MAKEVLIANWKYSPESEKRLLNSQQEIRLSLPFEQDGFASLRMGGSDLLRQISPQSGELGHHASATASRGLEPAIRPATQGSLRFRFWNEVPRPKTVRFGDERSSDHSSRSSRLVPPLPDAEDEIGLKIHSVPVFLQEQLGPLSPTAPGMIRSRSVEPQRGFCGNRLQPLSRSLSQKSISGKKKKPRWLPKLKPGSPAGKHGATLEEALNPILAVKPHLMARSGSPIKLGTSMTAHRPKNSSSTDVMSPLTAVVPSGMQDRKLLDPPEDEPLQQRRSRKNFMKVPCRIGTRKLNGGEFLKVSGLCAKPQPPRLVA